MWRESVSPRPDRLTLLTSALFNTLSATASGSFHCDMLADRCDAMLLSPHVLSLERAVELGVGQRVWQACRAFGCGGKGYGRLTQCS